VPLPFRDIRDESQRRRFKEMQANILSSLATSLLIFLGLVLAREFNPIEGDRFYASGPKTGTRSSYLSALNTTMYSKSHRTHSDFIQPYVHPHLDQFKFLFDYSDPIARMLNVIFHAPWFIAIFIFYGVGAFFLRLYYLKFHIWSDLIVENVYNHPTAMELLGLIEVGKVVLEEEEEEKEKEGLCARLGQWLTSCKVKLGLCWSWTTAAWDSCRLACRCLCRCHTTRKRMNNDCACCCCPQTHEEEDIEMISSLADISKTEPDSDNAKEKDASLAICGDIQNKIINEMPSSITAQEAFQET